MISGEKGGGGRDLVGGGDDLTEFGPFWLCKLITYGNFISRMKLGRRCSSTLM